MIDFDIDIEQKTPYLDLLESLIQQSHALKTIHNPKTWCLSALTYALHLNDCLVLFQDLKDRWCKELPFAEAWDVDFRQWKSDIWSAVNDTRSTTHENWKSLCDIDYKQFIELSNKVAEGVISLEPLLTFVEGKETSIAKIIVDAGGQLSTMFTEIESMIYESSSDLYQTFYDGCIEGYMLLHIDNLYEVKQKNATQTYQAWEASKSPKKRYEAIKKLIESIVKDIEGTKTLADIWDECFDSETNEIDSESIARNLFINRTSIISNKSYSYKDSLDKLFYAVTMIEFLQERLKMMAAQSDHPKTPEEIEKELKSSNVVFVSQVNGRNINYTKLREFLLNNAVETITYKNEWFGIYLFAYVHNLLADTSLNKFEEQMKNPAWFGLIADRKRCTADSMGDYTFLLNISQHKWEDANIIPEGSKATPSGQRRVLRKFNNLDVEYSDNLIAC